MKTANIRDAFAPFSECEETADGTQVKTHCLYPSFEQVSVLVIEDGDGFLVSDGGGATRSSWLHGVDAGAITDALERHAKRHHLELDDGVVTARAASIDWLPAAIMAVANASAGAATDCMG